MRSSNSRIPVRTPYSNHFILKNYHMNLTYIDVTFAHGHMSTLIEPDGSYIGRIRDISNSREYVRTVRLSYGKLTKRS